MVVLERTLDASTAGHIISQVGLELDAEVLYQNRKAITKRSGMLIHEMREALKDIPGLSIEYESSGHQKLTLGGKTLEVGPMASNDQVRTALTALPTVNLTEPTPMNTTPASSGFAASIRAMMDAARADLERAKSDGLAQISGAVSKLSDAKNATTKVAASMAKTIEDEASAVLSELGQISNDL